MSMTPLAERMRPRTLADYMGQDHILGENSGLRKAIESGHIPSMIFWGPPGVGKTTLAQIIANTVDRPFHSLSAINSGVKDIREIIAKVSNQGLFGVQNAILFIDEMYKMYEFCRQKFVVYFTNKIHGILNSLKISKNSQYMQ